MNDADGKAEHFCGNIRRISAKFSMNGGESSGYEQTENFILKSAPEKKDSADYSYLPREIDVYSNILSEAEKLLRSIGDHTRIAPR